MASESTDGGAVSSGDDLDTWLDERAGELGLDRESFVERLLAAYRAAVTDAGEDVGSLDERVDRLEREYEEHIEDVRKRVLQVKSTAEEKAPADHHHEAFDRLDEVDERVSALADRVESLSETTERLLDRESVTDDELAEVETKLDRLARAVVEMRNADEMRNDEGGQSAGDDRLRSIQRTAAREGHERADCDACGETVHVGLLPEASCPACGAAFHDIEGGGLFRTATLRVEGSEP